MSHAPKQWLHIDAVAVVFSGPYAGPPLALSPAFQLVSDQQQAYPFSSRERAEEYLQHAELKLKSMSNDYHWRVEEGRDGDKRPCYFLCGDKAKQKIWLHFVSAIAIKPGATEFAFPRDFGTVTDKGRAYRFHTEEQAETYLSDNRAELESKLPNYRWHVEQNLPFYSICGTAL